MKSNDVVKKISNRLYQTRVITAPERKIFDWVMLHLQHQHSLRFNLPDVARATKVKSAVVKRGLDHFQRQGLLKIKVGHFTDNGVSKDHQLIPSPTVREYAAALRAPQANGHPAGAIKPDRHQWGKKLRTAAHHHHQLKLKGVPRLNSNDELILGTLLTDYLADRDACYTSNVDVAHSADVDLDTTRNGLQQLGKLKLINSRIIEKRLPNGRIASRKFTLTRLGQRIFTSVIKKAKPVQKLKSSKANSAKPKRRIEPKSQSNSKNLSKMQITSRLVLRMIMLNFTSDGCTDATNQKIGQQLNLSREYAGKLIRRLRAQHLITAVGRTNNRWLMLTDRGYHFIKGENYGTPFPRPATTRRRLLKKLHQPHHRATVHEARQHSQISRQANLSKAQSTIFHIVIHHMQRSKRHDFVCTLSNHQMAKLAGFSMSYVSNLIRQLKIKHVIQTTGKTGNRVIYLAPEKDLSEPRPKSTPDLKSRVFRTLVNQMDHHQVQVDRGALAKHFRVPVIKITNVVSDLRRQHLIRTSTRNPHQMLLTPRGRHSIKHLTSRNQVLHRSTVHIPHPQPKRNHRPAGLERFVPLNVHVPIYPYEMIFRHLADKPMAKDDDQIVLKGSRFYEYVGKSLALQFLQNRHHHHVLAIRLCKPNRRDPSVVKLIKRGHQIKIWSTRLVRLFNQCADSDQSERLYLVGKKAGRLIVFNLAKVHAYYK